MDVGLCTYNDLERTLNRTRTNKEDQERNKKYMEKEDE